MTDWRPIETAPRDGTEIELMDEDCGVYRMRWNPAGWNEWVSTQPGLWECPEGFFTWCEENNGGPSYWRPLTDMWKTRPCA